MDSQDLQANGTEEVLQQDSPAPTEEQQDDIVIPGTPQQDKTDDQNSNEWKTMFEGLQPDDFDKDKVQGQNAADETGISTEERVVESKNSEDMFEDTQDVYKSEEQPTAEKPESDMAVVDLPGDSLPDTNDSSFVLRLSESINIANDSQINIDTGCTENANSSAEVNASTQVLDDSVVILSDNEEKINKRASVEVVSVTQTPKRVVMEDLTIEEEELVISSSTPKSPSENVEPAFEEEDSQSTTELDDTALANGSNILDITVDTDVFENEAALPKPKTDDLNKAEVDDLPKSESKSSTDQYQSEIEIKSSTDPDQVDIGRFKSPFKRKRQQTNPAMLPTYDDRNIRFEYKFYNMETKTETKGKHTLPVSIAKRLEYHIKQCIKGDSPGAASVTSVASGYLASSESSSVQSRLSLAPDLHEADDHTADLFKTIPVPRTFDTPSVSGYHGRQKAFIKKAPIRFENKMLSSSDLTSEISSVDARPSEVELAEEDIPEKELEQIENHVSKIEPGTKVFSQWIDHCYYPGEIVEKSRGNSWVVLFDDGNKRPVGEHNILAIQVLGKGLSVFVERNGDYDTGMIVGYKRKGGNILYAVEVDGSGQHLFSREKLMLSKDQASAVREKAFPSSPARPIVDVTLDNIVETKRQRGRSASANTISEGTPQKKKRINTPSSSNVGRSTPSSTRSSRSARKNASQGKLLFSDSSEGQRAKNKRKLPDSTSVIPAKKMHMDFIGKLPKNKELFSGIAVMLLITAEDEMIHPDLREELTRQLEAGGALIVNSVRNLKSELLQAKGKYLVARNYTADHRYMEALVHGICPVNLRWITESCATDELQGTSQYFLPRGCGWEQNIVEWNDSVADTYFEGKSFLVLSKNDPHFFSNWESVLVVGKAKKVLPYTSSKDSLNALAEVDIIVTDNSCPANVHRLADKKNIPVVSIQWLVTSVIDGEMAPFHKKYSHDKRDSDTTD